MSPFRSVFAFSMIFAVFGFGLFGIQLYYYTVDPTLPPPTLPGSLVALMLATFGMCVASGFRAMEGRIQQLEEQLNRRVMS